MVEKPVQKVKGILFNREFGENYRYHNNSIYSENINGISRRADIIIVHRYNDFLVIPEELIR